MTARPDPEPPPVLHERAEESLRYIRDTIARSASFTAVPGRGGVAMGAIGLAAALVAARQTSPRAWLGVWLVAGLAGFATGAISILIKARSAGEPVSRGAGRRFALSLLPSLVAGAGITVLLARAGAHDAMPPVWLLLYGVAVLSAGSHSVPAVPALGAVLFTLGLVALAAPTSWGDALLGAGFGVAHATAGVVIARRHGG